MQGVNRGAVGRWGGARITKASSNHRRQGVWTNSPVVVWYGPPQSCCQLSGPCEPGSFASFVPNMITTMSQVPAVRASYLCACSGGGGWVVSGGWWWVVGGGDGWVVGVLVGEGASEKCHRVRGCPASARLPHSHTHTHTHKLAQTHTRTLAHSHTRTLAHTHTRTHAHSHTRPSPSPPTYWGRSQYGESASFCMVEPHAPRFVTAYAPSPCSWSSIICIC